MTLSSVLSDRPTEGETIVYPLVTKGYYGGNSPVGATSYLMLCPDLTDATTGEGSGYHVPIWSRIPEFYSSGCPTEFEHGCFVADTPDSFLFALDEALEALVTGWGTETSTSAWQAEAASVAELATALATVFVHFHYWSSWKDRVSQYLQTVITGVARIADAGSSPGHVLTKNSATANASRTLREVSGLDAARLGEIFDVSRVTYQNWISGIASPRGSNREHLFEAVTLMQDAALRLDGPDAVQAWLLTPVTPGGPVPIEFLKSRDVEAFRGFLLRVKTGRESIRALELSPRARQPISRAALKAASQRISRAPALEDIETVGTDS